MRALTEGVARVYASAQIAAPTEAVFDYATTPANAPKWHPTSLGVSEDIDHSVESGERFTEELQVFAGRRVLASWTCVERIFPRRWVIEGTLGKIARGTITNTFRPQDDGTLYEREFVYTVAIPVLIPIDRLLLRRRAEAEASQALRLLKELLESQSDVVPGDLS